MSFSLAYLARFVATDTPNSSASTGPSSNQSGAITTTLATPNGAGLIQGVIAGEAQQDFSDTQSLAASGTMTYDLHAFAGAVDALGNVYALTRLVGIMIMNLATDPTAILNVTPGGSNPCNALAGSSGVIAVAPGGFYMQLSPSLASMGTLSATVKNILLTNASGSAQLPFKIFIVGS